jgi:hypothetical protein
MAIVKKRKVPGRVYFSTIPVCDREQEAGKIPIKKTVEYLPSRLHRSIAGLFSQSLRYSIILFMSGLG